MVKDDVRCRDNVTGQPAGIVLVRIPSQTIIHRLQPSLQARSNLSSERFQKMMADMPLTKQMKRVQGRKAPSRHRPSHSNGGLERASHARPRESPNKPSSSDAQTQIANWRPASGDERGKRRLKQHARAITCATTMVAFIRVGIWVSDELVRRFTQNSRLPFHSGILSG